MAASVKHLSKLFHDTRKSIGKEDPFRAAEDGESCSFTEGESRIREA
jgi:hypothetical protein